MTQTITETMTEFITETSNSLFRGSENKSNSKYIFDTQIEAAKEIVAAFNEKVTRRNHVMLVAKMQSGKTGVTNAVCNIINNLELANSMGIKKFFFITGMNDYGLKCQTYKRVLEQVCDATEDNVYTTNKRSAVKNCKYYVLKNSDLLKYEDSLDGSIIFIDECHYGSNTNNVLTKFLQKNSISWKDENSLITRNIYIVSISATPFDEIISDTAECKKIIELETEKDYIGVTDYIDGGFVHNGKFEDKAGDIIERLIKAKKEMDKDNVCGVAIVRTTDFQSIEQDEYVQANFDIYEMFANGSKIAYDKLNLAIDELIDRNKKQIKPFEGCQIFGEEEVEEVKPMLVLIKGAYRAGVTIKREHKDYIYMVYDYSVKSSTTAQAMLGRMCGYRDSNSKIKTHFYINDSMATMYSNWEQDFSNRENIPCDKTKQEWIEVGEYTGKETISSKSCGNFTIPLTDYEIEEIYKACHSKKAGRANAKKIFPTILNNRGIELKYDFFHEAHMKGKNNYAMSSQIKRFDNYSEDSLVFGFRPDKMKDFIEATGRDYITEEDLGKSCVSLVLDALIDAASGKVIGGNKRLLVYHAEVGAYRIVADQKSMYRQIKDTSIVEEEN